MHAMTDPSHPPSKHDPGASGFGAERAAHYDAQVSISLAGAQVAYELGVSALVAQLDPQKAASLLHVGLGTGAELLPYTRFDLPHWRFTGVEPSEAMIAVARARLEAEPLCARTTLHVGELNSLAEASPFDGAQMMGVLHHVAGEEARGALLRELARRLKPEAPVVIGCRVGADPVLTAIERRRWQSYGISLAASDERRKHVASVQPIKSDVALFEMLARAGFHTPRVLFVSLQYKVVLVRNAALAG